MMIVPLGSAGLSKRLGNRPSYARSRQLQWQLPRAGRDQRGHQPLDVRDLVGAQSARVGMRPRHSWRRTCQSRHTGFGRKNTKGISTTPAKGHRSLSLLPTSPERIEDTVQACVELSGDDKSTGKMSGTYHSTHAHASHGCNPQLRVLVAFSGWVRSRQCASHPTSVSRTRALISTGDT
jgi:hypothetical protein